VRHLVGWAVVAASVLTGAAAAQTPYVPDEWRYGRHAGESTLTYCIDKRDPDWPLAGDIGQAIAGALLLQAKPFVIEDDTVGDDIDVLYHTLLDSCDLYLGFKLIPDTLPDWLTVTRPYYRTRYLLVTKPGGAASLADLPRDKPIASTLGTAADLRLVQYLMALPAGERWPRYPMATDEAALRSVLQGSAAAALVWAPAVWALQQQEAAFAALVAIDPQPLGATRIEVGAALLGKESYLRSAIDQAIAALLADGSLAAMLARHHFPAEPPA
jgi:polar amino acid transport system substrate-binding protein